MARDVQLINCSGVLVHGDVDRFIGLGVDGLVIDNTYNGMLLIGHTMGAFKPSVYTVTGDFTIDGKYQIYEIDLDTIAATVNCTWVAASYPVEVTFKITSNTGNYDFIITTDPLPTGMLIDGNAIPYTTLLTTNDALKVYSNGTNLYITS